MHRITKLITGGQTGVDRGVMHFARDHGVLLGGWVPKDGWAEDATEAPGVLEEWPEFQATESADPEDRTLRNVAESHATLIILPPRVKSPGTDLTHRLCHELDRPHFVTPGFDLDAIVSWLDSLPQGEEEPFELHIAGPRASENGRGEYRAYRLLSGILTAD